MKKLFNKVLNGISLRKRAEKVFIIWKIVRKHQVLRNQCSWTWSDQQEKIISIFYNRNQKLIDLSEQYLN